MKGALAERKILATSHSPSSLFLEEKAQAAVNEQDGLMLVFGRQEVKEGWPARILLNGPTFDGQTKQVPPFNLR